jgi:hypothetical protein
MSLDVNGGGPVIQFGSVSGDLEIVRLDSAYTAAREAPPTDRDATQRLRRDDAPDVSGDDEAFRVEGGVQGRGPGSGHDESQAPRQSGEMAVLEAIERGEMSVDEGLQRLAELRNDF